MILITNGFSEIAQKLIEKLTSENFNHLILSAETQTGSGSRVYKSESLIKPIDVSNWLEHNADEVDFVFDLAGDASISKTLWSSCYHNQVPIIFVNANKGLMNWAKQQKKAPFFWKMLGESKGPDYTELVEELYFMMFTRNHEE